MSTAAVHITTSQEKHSLENKHVWRDVQKELWMSWRCSMEWTCTQKKKKKKSLSRIIIGKEKQLKKKKITSATIEARAKKEHEKQQQKKWNQRVFGWERPPVTSLEHGRIQVPSKLQDSSTTPAVTHSLVAYIHTYLLLCWLTPQSSKLAFYSSWSVNLYS